MQLSVLNCECSIKIHNVMRWECLPSTLYLYSISRIYSISNQITLPPHPPPPRTGRRGVS